MGPYVLLRRACFLAGKCSRNVPRTFARISSAGVGVHVRHSSSEMDVVEDRHAAHGGYMQVEHRRERL